MGVLLKSTGPPADLARREGWRAGLTGLQFKASLLIVLLICAVTSVGMMLGRGAMNALFYSNEQARCGDWAGSLAVSAARAVEAGDREALLRTVNDLICSERLAYAAFTDASGRMLASAESRAGLLDRVLLGPDRMLPLAAMEQPRVVGAPDPGPTCVEVIVPVHSPAASEHVARPARAVIGYLLFATDISEPAARLARVQDQLGRLAIGVALLVVPCSVIATRRVVGPLKDLACKARAFAAGDTDARAEVDSRDEIGELAASFNTMADRVLDSQRELLRLNANLEARVQQRTRELEELAARDPLTGLYNRRHFGEVIAREFASAERYDSDLTCLMFDLDHFKQINDEFGHRMGDAILIALAEAITAERRESDAAARFGGDEFILLLPQTSVSDASGLVHRIVDRFTRLATARYPGVPAAVSVGVASLRVTRARSSEALMHEADLALYAAKAGGRSQAVAATAS